THCPAADRLTEAAARAALAADVGPSARPLVLGVVLTDDERQQELNRTYRDTDAATNVLAFALADWATPIPPGAPALPGDSILTRRTGVGRWRACARCCACCAARADGATRARRWMR